MERLDSRTVKKILGFQRDEITEHFTYSKLARIQKNPHNRKVLNHISGDELRHYNFWRKFTGKDVEPDKWKIWKYYLSARLFGLTFGVKLMERGEANAQKVYGKMIDKIPGAKKIMHEEEEHEKELIGMIDEEKLKYVGSVVLGLNDALVELTGALAGFTFALQNTMLIGTVGLITGIAAAMSMAASEYLSTKEDGEEEKSPVKASAYTGIAYIITVMFLIFPYMILSNVYQALSFTIINAVIIILSLIHI